MKIITATKKSLTVNAYPGDAKTLLAFNLAGKQDAKNLAGFTIQVQPPGKPAYYLFNFLQFETPSQHAQLATDPPHSSVNAPFQKFRWVHIPGAVHQGIRPAMGSYTYTVTPRYFNANQSMQPLDPTLSVSLKVPVGPFQAGNLSLGFTRGYMQSQAFTNHFGPQALIEPPGGKLLFSTSQQAGKNSSGQTFTYADEYEWMGESARAQIFALLNQVLGDKSLQLDMFAYDLNEPDVIGILLKLAKQGRMRIILDNAALHHNSAGTKPEDKFTKLFQAAATGGAEIKRGKFGRYAHDKVLIISKKGAGKKLRPQRVLTGSTNFSVTGIYVNANHVLVFDDPAVAGEYSAVFNESWNLGVKKSFNKSPLATKPYQAPAGNTPKTIINFSPHTEADVNKILTGIRQRIQQEGKQGANKGSVFFAVMQMTNSPSPVYKELAALHKTQKILSYGISDSPGGLALYRPGNKQGVLVTGKPGSIMLPPPFDQVHAIQGHEIHDKFVVCGFNGKSPVVYCGSSNLATGGEENNGDNLLEIRDGGVATAFVIEALLLVDHYNFLDRYVAPARSTKGKKKAGKKSSPELRKQPRSKRQAALSQGMHLSGNDSWAASYFDPSDYHCRERLVFA